MIKKGSLRDNLKSQNRCKRLDIVETSIIQLMKFAPCKDDLCVRSMSYSTFGSMSMQQFGDAARNADGTVRRGSDGIEVENIRVFVWLKRHKP